jgi:hypothetical protein
MDICKEDEGGDESKIQRYIECAEIETTWLATVNLRMSSMDSRYLP